MAPDDPWRSHSGIPIRSLWLLLVYASDLANFGAQCNISTEDDVELLDILARLLVTVVERRLRLNPTRGYQRHEAVIPRVRGRIDWLQTQSRMHLERGRVACRFEELSFDIPRNRLVRAALTSIAGRIGDQGVANKCRRFSDDLGKLGVGAFRPSKHQVAGDPVASHQSEDRLMVSAATLALEILLPGEVSGETRASRLERDEVILRRIFEKSIAGFYRHELHGSGGWKVQTQSYQGWQLEPGSSRAVALLPGMVPDIILEQGERRIVIDTKFSKILTKGLHAGEKFRSANIYQIYAYLRSQAGRGCRFDRAEGILLYPSLDDDVDETFDIQGHRIRFVTVNLASKSSEVLERLRFIVREQGRSETRGSAGSDVES